MESVCRYLNNRVELTLTESIYVNPVHGFSDHLDSQTRIEFSVIVSVWPVWKGRE